MVDTEMTATPTQQPDALRLADVLEKMPGYDWNKTYCEAAFQLRYIQRQNNCLHTENEALKAAVAEAVAAEREACAKLAEGQTYLSRASLSSILGDDAVASCHVAAAIRARGTS